MSGTTRGELVELDVPSAAFCVDGVCEIPAPPAPAPVSSASVLEVEDEDEGEEGRAG